MALRNGDIERFAQNAAGEVHGRRHVRKLREGREVLEGPVTALAVEIEDVGRSVGRREDLLHSAEGHRTFPVAPHHGVGLGHRRDQLHQVAPVDAHPVAVDPCPGCLPEIRRFVVAELDALGLEQRHGRIVDPRELVRRHQVDDGNLAIEFWEEGDGLFGAGLLACGPPAALARLFDDRVSRHVSTSLPCLRLPWLAPMARRLVLISGPTQGYEWGGREAPWAVNRVADSFDGPAVRPADGDPCMTCGHAIGDHSSFDASPR